MATPFFRLAQYAGGLLRFLFSYVQSCPFRLASPTPPLHCGSDSSCKGPIVFFWVWSAVASRIFRKMIISLYKPFSNCHLAIAFCISCWRASWMEIERVKYSGTFTGALIKFVQSGAGTKPVVAPTRNRVGQLPFHLNLVIINERHFVGFRLLKNDLGSWLSSNLSFSLHYEKPAQKAFGVLQMIRGNYSRITRLDLRTLYGAHVRPLFEYADQIVYLGRTSDATLIERVQRGAAKMVAGRKTLEYEGLLVALDLIPLEYRLLQGDLIFTHVAFEHALFNRFFKIDPTIIWRRHGKKMLTFRARIFIRQNSFGKIQFYRRTPPECYCSWYGAVLLYNHAGQVDDRLEYLENINSTSLKVLEKNSQLRKLNGELKKEKNEFKRKMEELELRWTIVQEKEKIYRDSLIKFEKMLRDNDEKKLRALRKLANERSLQKTNEVELEILRKTNKQLLSQRQRLENKVANLRKYQRFLQELVKRSEYFSDISEVLSRYNALKANLEDLKCVDQMNNLCFEDLSTHLHQYKEEKSDEKLSLTNELTALRRRLEDSQTENRNRENLWVHTRDDALQRVSELCELKGSVLNMYRTARKYEKYGEDLSSENTVDQLEVIKDFILDLSEIVKEVS
ncbi:hypothetical protein T265_04521 [Opisthorchis viverrini]|uniref:DUF4200 domain-containing protein n=1 Tax=Opisthorchis viverrini TaxID=6198 RepID=A0A075AGH9_OPIVI|nr:hypothetical protein T265_04521 [Opisthorchis viverrini]KER28734.1 hypothetical protein T265_04521 [Opisthorchis viverrini]